MSVLGHGLGPPEGNTPRIDPPSPRAVCCCCPRPAKPARSRPPTSMTDHPVTSSRLRGPLTRQACRRNERRKHARTSRPTPHTRPGPDSPDTVKRPRLTDQPCPHGCRRTTITTGRVSPPRRSLRALRPPRPPLSTCRKPLALHSPSLVPPRIEHRPNPRPGRATGLRGFGPYFLGPDIVSPGFFITRQAAPSNAGEPGHDPT